MACDIRSRTVVVTGGANGIGAALANEAAARGAKRVAIVDVNRDAAAAVAEAISSGDNAATATAHVCDVSSAPAVEALAADLFSQGGPPALVCANAGVAAPTASVIDTDPDNAEWVLSVNLRGVFHVLRSFGRRLVDTDEGGWLMATGSEHSLGVPHLNAGLYTASKHAVLGLCDVLRGELPDHVGVSVLCPGLTTSHLWQAGELRPDSLGGPIEADPQAGAFFDNAGMPAATVAERAFDGLEEGHFLIPTHYNARTYAERRAVEAEAAFERLATVDTTDYDVTTLVTNMLAALGEPES